MLIESVRYNRVLDSGNLFTKGFAEEVVRRFKEDKDFRSSIELVQTPSNSDRMEIEYPYVAGALKELYLTPDCLMADVEILDTPQGRIIKRLSEYDRGDKFILIPRFMWEPLRVDGIDIISAGSYSWLSFVVHVKSEWKARLINSCELSGEHNESAKVSDS